MIMNKGIIKKKEKEKGKGGSALRKPIFFSFFCIVSFFLPSFLSFLELSLPLLLGVAVTSYGMMLLLCSGYNGFFRFFPLLLTRPSHSFKKDERNKIPKTRQEKNLSCLLIFERKPIIKSKEKIGK